MAKDSPQGKDRKAFLVRLPPKLHAELRSLANSELRSLNSQIEFMLRDGLKRRGRKAQEEAREEAPPSEEPLDEP